MLRTAFIHLTTFTLATSTPANNLHLYLDVAIIVSNTVSAHDIKFVDNDLRSSFFLCDEEGLFSDLDECTEFYHCIDNGDGGLSQYDLDCALGVFDGRDSCICSDPAYLKARNSCCKAPAVGEIEKARGEMVVQGGKWSNWWRRGRSR